jgi:uncharacterized membrane protein
MSLRTPTERMIQTLSFEAIGLCLSVPLCMAVNKGGAGDNAALLGVLTLAILLWSPLHNTLFDMVDLRATGRVASQRRRGLRLVHALSHEVTSVAVTLPIMVVIGGHTVQQALTMNLVLTLFYAGYAYVFHLGYDRLRPVAPSPAAIAA